MLNLYPNHITPAYNNYTYKLQSNFLCTLDFSRNFPSDPLLLHIFHPFAHLSSSRSDADFFFTLHHFPEDSFSLPILHVLSLIPFHLCIPTHPLAHHLNQTQPSSSIQRVTSSVQRVTSSVQRVTSSVQRVTLSVRLPLPLMTYRTLSHCHLLC